MIKIEYGAMSSKYEIKANNQLTAYCAMCIHYDRSAHLIAIYTEEYKKDSWISITGQISERLDEIFGVKVCLINILKKTCQRYQKHIIL